MSIIEIVYKSRKTEKICRDKEYARKKYGDLICQKLYAAINYIENAQSLNDIACYPTYQLHQLIGNRANQFAIDLGRKLGYRLIFTPNPPISEEDNKLDFSSKCKIVKSIILLEVSKHYE